MTPENTHDQDPVSPLEDMIVGDEASADDDLGRRMGRDAQRVQRGDLSQREFYEKYHEEVLEEFGFDHRSKGDHE